MEGLYLSNFEPNKIKTNKKVKQFYQEIPEVEYEVEYEVEEEIIHDGHEILEPDEYIVDFTNFIAPEN